MTDRTLNTTAALREAHLQRLEASLAAKAALKPSGVATSQPDPNNKKTNTPSD